MRIKAGDILELSNGTALEVLEGESLDGISGNLIVVEIDEDNKHISEPFQYYLTIASPIIDVIR